MGVGLVLAARPLPARPLQAAAAVRVIRSTVKSQNAEKMPSSIHNRHAGQARAGQGRAALVTRACVEVPLETH